MNSLTPAVPEFLDLVAMIRQASDRARVGIRNDISQADALTLLYAALIGERDGPGRMARRLLPLHLVLPGTGRPDPGCAFCHGAGEAPAADDLGAQHCHCRCDLCMCSEALCDGPCESIGVMLDELVLRGVPAGAVDVTRTLSRLQSEGVRRIVAHTTNREPVIVDPVDGQPGAAWVTVSSTTAVDLLERELQHEGFWCELRALPAQVGAVRLIVVPRY
ncbi:hypothetical protein AB0A95_30695 [Micromonospora sp. NPDC049230]|uniref:hypothetical protein n=1 Tax=Micromonospora sp. NPDC049230 TaxID=3155502 RepID=UPI0033FAE4F0